MSVTAQQLHEGGSVYYKVQIPRPGAQAEVRLKAARVIDVERGAATIQLLEEGQTRKVRFANLAPDIDYLAGLERDRTPATKPVSVWPVDEIAPEPVTPPTALEVPARRPSARPLTHTLADQLKHVELDNVHALRGPSDNEQAAPAPAPPATPPPAESAGGDMQAWLEITKDLRAKIDREILTAPRSQVAGLMAQRKQIETELQAKESGKAPSRMAYQKMKRDDVLKDAAAGMKPPALAQKHKVPYSTVAQWIRAEKVAPSVNKPRPAPHVAPARVSARKAPRVRPYEDTPGVALATVGSVDGSLRENRRLRAMLGALLTRIDSVRPDAVDAQNRQLQNVLDLLLGVE